MSNLDKKSVFDFLLELDSKDNVVLGVLELKNEISKLVFIIKEQAERIDVLEDIVNDMNEGSEEDDDPEVGVIDSSGLGRVLEHSDVQLVQDVNHGQIDSDDDKSSDLQEWKQYQLRSARLSSNTQPKPNVRYTQVEYDEYLKNGFTSDLGFKWLKWSDDKDSWWQLLVKRS